MRCPNCGNRLRVSKNLHPDDATEKSDSCPECGCSVDKSEGGNRDLITK